MDASDQRRKRKRILRQSSTKSLPSVRTFTISFTFFIFLCLLSRTPPFTSSVYPPVLVTSSLNLLSSATTRTVKSVHDFGGLLAKVQIEDRVLFPDHILLLVKGKIVRAHQGLECVYYSGFTDSFVRKKILSLDEFDGFRSIVRCPIAPLNCSNVVSLAKIKVPVGNLSVHSWDNLAYAATLDGNDVVVFVKGLNLRPDREANPDFFTCHFGSSRQSMISTKASNAAQEVVRCSLPKSLRDNPGKAQGIPVTVGLTSRRRDQKSLFPSVARISNPGSTQEVRTKRHDLCVCTMVWNQAPALREWITYHSWLGVERWFIYDNNSDDEIDRIVQILNSKDYNVTRHVWPWIKTQEAGFSHCVLRAKDECNWVSFMDVDEYFYFPYASPGHNQLRPVGYASNHALRNLIRNITSQSNAIAEIRTSCHSFGPSGLRQAPLRGVMVGYTCRLQSPERHKSIIRPDALDPSLLNAVHHFRLKKGLEYMNLAQGTAVINHYKYQVWEVFRAKFHRRVATYVVDWQENQNEGSRDRAPGLGTAAIEPPDWPRKFCELWDTGLRDFVLGNLGDGGTGMLPWEVD